MSVKKSTVIAASIALVSLASCSWGAINISWGYAGDLQTWDPTVQQGWLVQMFHDNDGGGFGDLTIGVGGVVGGDALISGASQLLAPATRSGGATWGGITGVDAGLYEGENVYTVLFNAGDIASATQYVILDAATHGPLPGDLANDSYTLQSVAGNWVAVPEPGTMALMLLGVISLGIRKRFKKQ